MSILDLKSNLSNFRKPTTVLEQEKKKIREATPVKAVYSTSNELLKQTDIKINKVDNSTSIQVPGAKKIDYKLFSINTKRSKGIPSISTFFGDTIGTKESLFKKIMPNDIVKISEYKEQRPKTINQPSEFIKITPRVIQHISSIEILKTILKEKLSLYKDQFPADLLKISLYQDQLPIKILKLSLYKDQIPAILDKSSLYKDQIPKVLDKLSLYKQKTFTNGGFYDTRDEIIRLLKFPYTIQIYANKRTPFVNAFDDLSSGAKGFTLNQTSTSFLNLDTDALTYTYPVTVKEGRLKDITKIKGALQWPSKVTFSNALDSTKYYRTVYDIKKPYLTSSGITGDNLLTYFYRTNSPSAKDIIYTKFNLRDSSFNTGLALFNQPLILTGIQRKGKGGYASELNILDTWKFDDGFIRGGVVTSTQRAIVDTLRIGKWLASPKGLLFITRQAGLQGSSVNTEANPTLEGRLKSGAYSLASILANTATQHLGIRLRKDAIPFIPTTTYSSALSSPLYKNRLIMLKDAYLGTKFDPRLNNLLNGLGGPQSVYGIGRTNISRAVNSSVINYSNEPRKEYYTLGYNDISERSSLTSLDYKVRNFLLKGDGQPLNNDVANSKWISTKGAFGNTVIQDYAKTSQHQRKKLQVPDYGKRGKDLTNPLSKDIMKVYSPGNTGMIDPIWKINQTNKEAVDDFVKFMFHDLNTNERFRFRAYIENISEDFNPSWQEVKILGRADSPYIYQGFERGVSISFKVAALSRGDLMLMWDQLERLAKTTVPQYQSEYKMKGPLIKFTLGNWFIDTPAFVKSLSYTVDNETPWEINLGDSNIYGPGADEYSVGELPMIVSVQISMQIFGEVRPETIKPNSLKTPAGIEEDNHYSQGNLYPLGGRPADKDRKIPATDFRKDRQAIFK